MGGGGWALANWDTSQERLHAWHVLLLRRPSSWPVFPEGLTACRAQVPSPGCETVPPETVADSVFLRELRKLGLQGRGRRPVQDRPGPRSSLGSGSGSVLVILAWPPLMY